MGAKTAPAAPTPAMIKVPMPRLEGGKVSFTKVIPAPNSPAKPIPAIKRKRAYVFKSVTKPFKALAAE